MTYGKPFLYSGFLRCLSEPLCFAKLSILGQMMCGEVSSGFIVNTVGCLVEVADE